MKIVVLCGGLSTERNISFLSASRVCRALRARGHQAVLVDLFLGLEPLGEEYLKDPGRLFEELPEVPELTFGGSSPDLKALCASRKDQSPSIFGPGVIEICRLADIVFNGLHGGSGEDGRVAAAFDMLGIPYTGSGHLGAAMAMDKMITKKMVSAQGVLTPAWKEYHGVKPAETSGNAPGKSAVRDAASGSESVLSGKSHGSAAAADREGNPPASGTGGITPDEIARQTQVPCVVKTPGGGSSVGVIIVKEQKDLRPALEQVLRYSTDILIEQFIDGKEFTNAVLLDRPLPCVEINPPEGGYDYANKYKAGATEEICPGRLPEEQAKRMGEIALAVHRIMGLRTYSRSDFLIDEKGDIYFLEVNTLPGMTKTSLVPQEAAAAGISYEELCEIIVEDGLKR